MSTAAGAPGSAPTDTGGPGVRWRVVGNHRASAVVSPGPQVSVFFVCAILVLEWVVLGLIGRRWRVVARFARWRRGAAIGAIGASLFAGLGIHLFCIGPVVWIDGTWVRRRDVRAIVERHAPHPMRREDNIAVQCTGRVLPVRAPRPVLDAFLTLVQVRP